MQEFTLATSAGRRLHVNRWPVRNAPAACLISHGWSEHGGRYAHLAQWLNARGYEVWAPDHQGHGKSTGGRGHVRNWQDYVDDLERVRLEMGFDRCFLIGHSMGGMISVLHLLNYPNRFDAVALSSPAMDISVQVPKVKALISAMLNRVWPSLALPNPVDPDVVCSDPKVVEAYLADPYNHGKISVRWFEDYQRMIERVKGQAAEIQTPIGIWHGGQDTLVAPWTSRQFFDRLSVPARHYEVLEQARHEVLNEPDWQQTAQAMLEWMESHDQALAAAS